MIQFGFPKFQRQLFVILIAGTYWGLPALYKFADRLEFEALSAQPLGRDTGDFDTSAAASRVAGGLLYGGTIAMLALSIYVWYRMYLIAPEMFRIFAKVVGLGAAVGAALYSFGAPEVAALAAATATAFAAMAHGAMEYDTYFQTAPAGVGAGRLRCLYGSGKFNVSARAHRRRFISQGPVRARPRESAGAAADDVALPVGWPGHPAPRSNSVNF